MSTRQSDKRVVLQFAALILVISMLACALPTSLGSDSSSNPPSEGGISSDVSTQVAATLYAHAAFEKISATSEAYALQTQLALSTNTPELEFTQPTATAVVSPPTLLPEPSATATLSLPELPPPPPPPPLPPQFQNTPVIEEGLPPIQPLLPPLYEPKSEGFDAVGVNLTSCRSQNAINILIYNNANTSLESMTLNILDRTDGLIILDRFVSDTPFYFDDKSCSTGEIPLLEPGQALFIGNPISGPLRSGHKVFAEIKLCTENELQGRCYTQTMEFTAP
jgi:hypothetical protein